MLDGSQETTLATDFFYKKVLACICNGLPFAIELQDWGKDMQPMWFCWMQEEKPEPDFKTLKWARYDVALLRNKKN